MLTRFLFSLQKGANKVPVNALIVVTLVTLLFIVVGDINTLAPVVTTTFMLTYTAVCYSYFALAMSYDRRKQREDKFSEEKQPVTTLKVESATKESASYGSTNQTVGPMVYEDSFQRFASDLDKLFPERLTHRGQHHLARQHSDSNSPTTPEEAVFDATAKNLEASPGDISSSETGDTTQLLKGNDSKSGIRIFF